MGIDVGTIYSTLLTHGLTDSQYDFSARWMGRCKSYLSSTRSRQRELKVETLLQLAANLSRAAAALRQGHRTVHASILEDMNRQLWLEVLARYP